MTSAAPSPWRVEYRQGPAGLLLAESLQALQALRSGRASAPELASPGLAGPAAAATRLARILQIDPPALILGSGQAETDVDPVTAARAGVQVVRRSTGGGAVLMDSNAVLWIDLIIPAGDPLWASDVRRATWWVGEAWAAAVDQVGAGPAQVWRGGMQPSDWSRRVCFAGLGPGEVVVGSQKVVGISQRRTRQGVLFQTAALLRWEPAALVTLLAPSVLTPGVSAPAELAPAESARTGAATQLDDLAAGVGAERAGALTAALLAALPDPPSGG